MGGFELSNNGVARMFKEKFIHEEKKMNEKS